MASGSQSGSASGDSVRPKKVREIEIRRTRRMSGKRKRTATTKGTLLISVSRGKYRVSQKKRNFDFGGQYLRFKSTYWGK